MDPDELHDAQAVPAVGTIDNYHSASVSSDSYALLSRIAQHGPGDSGYSCLVAPPSVAPYSGPKNTHGQQRAT